MKMISRRTIRNNLLQIASLTEKNIKLHLRFKFQIIIAYISPIISILMPLIIFGQFFELKSSIGPWTAENYLVFQFIAYNLFLLRGILSEYPNQIRNEKFWKTLPGLIIAPLNRYNLLFGIFFSHLILISAPFIIFIVSCYIYSPISFGTLLFIICIYFLITLIFSGIGLIFGVFAISNENVWRLLMFLINIVFWLSCITYPFELFPNFVQDIINLNPLYYIFDFLRVSWIQDNVVLTISTYYSYFLVLIIFTVILCIIGVKTFNFIYKKYGIVGY
ncbi:MAG: ABC transporter permease [Candidatus Odinarchaeota archaeon]